jgi:hypothetical protein
VWPVAGQASSWAAKASAGLSTRRALSLELRDVNASTPAIKATAPTMAPATPTVRPVTTGCCWSWPSASAGSPTSGWATTRNGRVRGLPVRRRLLAATSTVACDLSPGATSTSDGSTRTSRSIPAASARRAVFTGAFPRLPTTRPWRTECPSSAFSGGARATERALNGRISTTPAAVATGAVSPAGVTVTSNDRGPATGTDALGTRKPTRTVSAEPGVTSTVSGATQEYGLAGPVIATTSCVRSRPSLRSRTSPTTD